MALYMFMLIFPALQIRGSGPRRGKGLARGHSTGGDGTPAVADEGGAPGDQTQAVSLEGRKGS